MDLDLCEPALSAATDFSQAFPWCVFTSGRRSLEAQAHAMATNAALNRRWIAQTYVASEAAQACQMWIDGNVGAERANEIAAGLLVVLQRFTEEQLGKLTKHLAGLAFDVQPVADPRGAAPRAWLMARAAQCGGKFLDREGGLLRWHWQAPGVGPDFGHGTCA